MPEPTDVGPPRRPGPKSARTRQRLLDAAAAVISRRGFSGTRLSDIADVADVRAPAIYYYFDSREELVEEVMFVGARAMLDHLRTTLDALAAGTPAIDRIDAAVEAHLRLELDISDYSRAIIRNANQLPPDVNTRALALVADYNHVWAALVADLAAEGRLRPDLEPTVARMLVLGALNWAAEWYDPRAGPVDAVVATAQAVVRGALSTAGDGDGRFVTPTPAPRRDRWTAGG